MSVYIQLDKLRKLSEVDNWNDLKDKPEIVDDGSNTLCITDVDGNIIAEIDEDGIHTTELELGDTTESKVKVKEHIADLIRHITAKERAHWNDKSFGSITDNPINAENTEALYITDADGNIIAKIDEDGIHSVGFRIYGEDVRPCYEQEETYERGSTTGAYANDGFTYALATTETIAPDDLTSAEYVVELTSGESGSQVFEDFLWSGLNRVELKDSNSNVVGYNFSTRFGLSYYSEAHLFIIYDYEACNALSYGYSFPSNGIYLGEAYYDVTVGSTPYANYTTIKSITGNFITKLDNKFLDLPNNKDFIALKTWKEKVDNGALTVPMADEAEKAESAEKLTAGNFYIKSGSIGETLSGVSLEAGKAYLIVLAVGYTYYTVSLYVHTSNVAIYSTATYNGYYCLYNHQAKTLAFYYDGTVASVSSIYIREL